MNRLRPIIAAAAALVLLAGCGKQTNIDRPEVTTPEGVEIGGKFVDATWIATEVHMYLNADGVPTTILYCAGGFRFFSGASSTVDGGKSTGAQIQRLPEQDYLCANDPQNFPKVPR